LQMNKDDQLRRLEELGVFHDKPTLPTKPDEPRRLVNPYDRSLPLEVRARSYLHANCAQCHVEAGGGNAQIDLEFKTARDKMRAVNVKPLHDSFGIQDAKLIVPGDPEKSILYQRLKRRGPGQMPPLATAVADDEAVRLIHDWIKDMKPAPDKPAGKK